MLILVLLAVSACATAQPELTEEVVETPNEQSAEDGEDPGITNKNQGNTLGGSAENDLSAPVELVVGTLLLEETDMAVDPELAERLLPYWKMYKSLAESDTAAPEEMDAVISEILEIMGSERLSAISSMEITSAAMSSLVNELGISEKRGSSGAEEGSGSGGMGGRPEGMPEGVQPGGGMGGSGNVDPELRATRQAEMGQRAVGRFTIPLLEELIAVLEAKVEG